VPKVLFPATGQCQLCQWSVNWKSANEVRQ